MHDPDQDTPKRVGAGPFLLVRKNRGKMFPAIGRRVCTGDAHRDHDQARYRTFYSGYAENLFGSLGRFEGICMASITATCP